MEAEEVRDVIVIHEYEIDGGDWPLVTLSKVHRGRHGIEKLRHRKKCIDEAIVPRVTEKEVYEEAHT